MATCGLCGLANPDGAGACQRCSASLVATPAWGSYGGYQPSPLGFPPQGYGPQGSYGAPLPGLAMVGLCQENGVARLVHPSKIDDHYVWLKGVDAAYLAELPPTGSGGGRSWR
jgi:hypothetical protein